MIVKDEETVLRRCLNSARPLIQHWTILDTGSTDGTRKVAEKALKGIPGEYLDHPWDGFASSMTAALRAAGEHTDWVLRLDADMTVEAHPDLIPWLETDPDPTVDAWNVMIDDHGMQYRLPLLLRRGIEWKYQGAAHEWLDGGGRKTRSLLGLTVTHHHDGGNQEGKMERYLGLLAPACAAGEPRETFYTAECLRFLGREAEAIEMYELRASMNGFEEERWYASYQAAKLRQDPEALLVVWRQRPHRHEPLTAAANLIASREHDDVLFLSPPGSAF